MAGKKEIGVKIAVEGENQYKSALKSINQENKLLQSEMKALKSEYKDNAGSIDALSSKGKELQKMYENQKSKVKIYADALEESKDKMKKAGDATNDYRTKLGQATEKLDEMKRSGNATNEEIEEQERIVKDLKESLTKAESGYTAAEKATNQWEIGLNNAKSGLYDLDSEISKNDAALKDAENSTDDLADSTDDLGKEMDESGEKSKIFGQVLLASLASNLIMSAIDSIKDGLSTMFENVVESGSNFEAAMSQVAATMGMTSEEIHQTGGAFDALKAAASKCGEETKYSATEAAEALNYMALAGYDSTKAIETLPKVLNLAAAGGFDLATASDMVTDSMSALQLESGDLDKFIDQLAKTSQKSNTNVEQLGEAILTVGGTATQLAGGITEMNTVLGIFADNGIKASEGGTHLRNVILAMNPTTDKAIQAFEQLGVQTYDVNGDLRSLQDVFQDLNLAMDGMTSEEKTGFLVKIFNKTDLTAVNALLANCGARFDELSGYIENSTGAAQTMSDVMQNNLMGDITIMSSATEGLSNAVYDCFNGTFRSSVQNATGAIGELTERIRNGDLKNTFQELSGHVGDLAEGLINFASNSVGVVASAFNFLVSNGDLVIAMLKTMIATYATFTAATAIQGLVEQWKAYRAAVEGATVAQTIMNGILKVNPYVLAATAIVGIGTALYSMVSASQDAKSENDKFNDSIGETLNVAKQQRESLQENNAEFKDLNKRYSSQASLASDLANKLYVLASKEKLTNEEKTKMRVMVKELNTMYPELGLKIDNMTGKLNLEREAVLKTIEAYKQKALEEAAQEHYTEIAQKKIDAMMNEQTATENLQTAQDNYNTALAEKARIESEIQQARASGNDDAHYYELLQGQLESTCGTLDEYGATLDKAKGAHEEASQAVSDLEKEESKLDTTINSVSTEQYSEGVEKAADSTGDLGEATANAEDDVMSFADIIKTASDEIALSFEKIDNTSAKSAKEMAKNFTENIKAGQEAEANWTALSKKYGEEFALFLKNNNLVNNRELKNLANDTKGNTDKIYNEWKKTFGTDTPAAVQSGLNTTKTKAKTGADGVKKAVNSSLDTLPVDAKKTGSQTGDSLKGGLQSKQPSVNAAMISIHSSAMRSFNTTTFNKLGLDAISGVSGGISSNSSKVTGAMSSLSSKAKTSFSTSGYSSVGSSIVSGIKSGIDSNGSSLFTKLNTLASRALASAKKALGINSPSRLFRDQVGKSIPEGMALGIEKNMGMVENSVSKMKGLASGIETSYVVNGTVNTSQSEAASNLDSAYMDFTSQNSRTEQLLTDLIEITQRNSRTSTKEMINAFTNGLSLEFNGREFARVVKANG